MVTKLNNTLCDRTEYTQETNKKNRLLTKSSELNRKIEMQHGIFAANDWAFGAVAW